MRLQHIIAAILVAAIWGASFVVVRLGLLHFPPLLLAALRFAVAAMAVLFVAKPDVPWSRLILIGSTLFVGEFGFLFVGMANDMPAGLASIVIQCQAFFTLIFAAVAFGLRPARRQAVGMLVGFAGLSVIGSTVGGDVSTTGLALVIAAAVSWAIGNILLKMTGPVDMLALVAWMSLVPPLPLLLLSLIFEGPARIGGAITAVDWAGLAAVAYLAFPATLLAFWIWGKLIRTYSAQVVAPFSLLVPIFGIVSAALVFDEKVSATRLGGMALVIVGLAIVILPARMGVVWRRPVTE